MEKQRLSLSALEAELEELRKDRTAFVKALDNLRVRIDESIASVRKFPPLHQWSGTRACVGSLEMAVTHIEGNISEYLEAIRLIREGFILNSDEPDKPRFGVIEGGDPT